LGRRISRKGYLTEAQFRELLVGEVIEEKLDEKSTEKRGEFTRLAETFPEPDILSTLKKQRKEGSLVSNFNLNEP